MTTTSSPMREATSPVKETGLIAKTADYLDQRTSMSGLVKELGRKIFPDHWSFMLGEVALYSFVAILLSGTFLTFFFDPS
ncbi:MAG: ubiquinol-cytochrome c reductase cytochrome b subunit, partial [Pseudoclavibacter sp.]